VTIQRPLLEVGAFWLIFLPVPNWYVGKVLILPKVFWRHLYVTLFKFVWKEERGAKTGSGEK
jgi:hypothetical protein